MFYIVMMGFDLLFSCIVREMEQDPPTLNSLSTSCFKIILYLFLIFTVNILFNNKICGLCNEAKKESTHILNLNSIQNYITVVAPG